MLTDEIQVSWNGMFPEFPCQIIASLTEEQDKLAVSWIYTIQTDSDFPSMTDTHKGSPFQAVAGINQSLDQFIEECMLGLRPYLKLSGMQWLMGYQGDLFNGHGKLAMATVIYNCQQVLSTEEED